MLMPACLECPYCETPAEEVEERGTPYVNGIRPVRGDGCEFCNPLPVTPDRSEESEAA